MRPDPEDTCAAWSRRARAGAEPARVPDDAPPQEYRRTPAAARIAELAADAGLFHFHFERRVHLPLPEAWVPPADPSLADAPTWDGGILPEQKYQSFRHDLPLASYHPHHRAKWAVHELCHGLVGFAWHTDATPFFHATAGRLAELLPVALWYFFDEAWLRRCPDHQSAGSLFRTLCPACEAVAGAWPDDDAGPTFVHDGVRFLDRELAAIRRSRNLGRPIPHLWASIDLCSDGIAYATAHARRLESDDFRCFADRFLVAGGGWSPDLDQLEARVHDVATALLGDTALAPLAPSPDQARWRWILQDVGYRLTTIRADTDGEALHAIDALLDALSEPIRSTTLPGHDVGDAAARALTHARTTWRELSEEWELPPTEDVFALGYTAPGADLGTASLADGLRTALPITVTLLDERLDALTEAFAATDGLARVPLAHRFAASLPPPLRDLASWEAHLAHLRPVPNHLDGPGEGHRLAPGLSVLSFDVDVMDLAERADRGDIDLTWVDGLPTLISHEGGAVMAGVRALVLGRDANGELLVVDVEPDTADVLRLHPDDPAPHLDPAERAALEQVGVLVPKRLAERRTL